MHVQRRQINVLFQKILDLYVSEVEQRLSQKQVLREENQDVVSLRPDEYHFSKLDSSLKKNTAFVRKLVSTMTFDSTVILNIVYLVLYMYMLFMK